jgi:hypothetical protein
MEVNGEVRISDRLLKDNRDNYSRCSYCKVFYSTTLLRTHHVLHVDTPYIPKVPTRIPLRRSEQFLLTPYSVPSYQIPYVGRQ